MIEELAFPESVTSEERDMKWKKIAEISDSDFGFKNFGKKNNKIRFNTRIILEGFDRKICVIKSEKYEYMQIPGGGIEERETIVEGLRRETEEETGYIIEKIKPLGYIVEHRESVRNKHPWDKSISFVFKASPLKKTNTKYTDDEIIEEFIPTWVEVDSLIEDFKKKDGKVESYSGSFSNRRDYEILKFYQSQQKSDLL